MCVRVRSRRGWPPTHLCIYVRVIQVCDRLPIYAYMCLFGPAYHLSVHVCACVVQAEVAKAEAEREKRQRAEERSAQHLEQLRQVS